MALACPASPPDTGFVLDLLGSVDCNIRGLTETGYGALARPGSPVAAALTILLTLYIGFMGFGLLTGRTSLRVGDVTISALKIGVVLALATSWPTYQQLVFQTLFDGPEQIAASVLSAVQPGGSVTAGPFESLQTAYDALQASAVWYGKHSVTFVSPLQGGPAFGALALNSAAMLLLLSSVGVVLTAKIVLGLFLGLGPIFVALLLFDATRGLFEGWLRAVIAVALTPLLATLSLLVQLVLLAPHIAVLAEQQAQGSVEIGAANAILVLSLVGALVTVGLIGAVGTVALGLRLPGQHRNGSAHGSPSRVDTITTTVGRTSSAPTSSAQSHPRADAVAAAAIALERRDHRILAVAETPRRLSTGPARIASHPVAVREASLGRSYRRPPQPRRAASSLRRDG